MPLLCVLVTGVRYVACGLPGQGRVPCAGHCLPLSSARRHQLQKCCNLVPWLSCDVVLLPHGLLRLHAWLHPVTPALLLQTPCGLEDFPAVGPTPSTPASAAAAPVLVHAAAAADLTFLLTHQQNLGSGTSKASRETPKEPHRRHRPCHAISGQLPCTSCRPESSDSSSSSSAYRSASSSKSSSSNARRQRNRLCCSCKRWWLWCPSHVTHAKSHTSGHLPPAGPLLTPGPRPRALSHSTPGHRRSAPSHSTPNWPREPCAKR